VEIISQLNYIQMKKGILVLLMALMGSLANAQKVSDSEVPAAVKAKFTALYPSTKGEKWMKKDGKYDARFETNKITTCVLISSDGVLLQTAVGIDASALPATASDYIKKNYVGKKTTNAEKVTTVAGLVSFKAEVNESKLSFDSNGAFISAVKEKK
jgi:hypothetical protein